MEATIGQSFKLFEKYEKNVHKSTENAMKDYKDFLVKSPLKVRLLQTPKTESNLLRLRLANNHYPFINRNFIYMYTKCDILSASQEPKNATTRIWIFSPAVLLER